MKRTNKDRWKQFEQQVAAKRTGTKKQSHLVPEDLVVQRMSPIATGRIKKYEPLDNRDFVPFTDFYEVSLENVKIACERHYRLCRNSCDVLVSDRGASCSRFERFLENREQAVVSPDTLISSTPGNFSVPVTMISNVTDAKHVTAPPSVFAQSVSIAALLKAAKLVKTKVPEKLES